MRKDKLTELREMRGEGQARRRRGTHRRPARQGQADGPRAHRPAAGQRHLPGAGPARHAQHQRLRHGGQEIPRRRRGDRLREDRRPPRGRLRPGFHHIGRLLLRGAVAQGLQSHGAGPGERHPGGRPARLGRRTHPGRGAVAGGLRRAVRAQRDGLGRGPADLACRWVRARAARSTRRRSPISSS